MRSAGNCAASNRERLRAFGLIEGGHYWGEAAGLRRRNKEMPLANLFRLTGWRVLAGVDALPCACLCACWLELSCLPSLSFSSAGPNLEGDRLLPSRHPSAAARSARGWARVDVGGRLSWHRPVSPRQFRSYLTFATARSRHLRRPSPPPCRAKASLVEPAQPRLIAGSDQGAVGGLRISQTGSIVTAAISASGWKAWM
jgi:hypothetical protein